MWKDISELFFEELPREELHICGRIVHCHSLQKVWCGLYELLSISEYWVDDYGHYVPQIRMCIIFISGQTLSRKATEIIHAF